MSGETNMTRNVAVMLKSPMENTGVAVLSASGYTPLVSPAIHTAGPATPVIARKPGKNRRVPWPAKTRALGGLLLWLNRHCYFSKYACHIDLSKARPRNHAAPFACIT